MHTVGAVNVRKWGAGPVDDPKFGMTASFTIAVPIHETRSTTLSIDYGDGERESVTIPERQIGDPVLAVLKRRHAYPRTGVVVGNEVYNVWMLSVTVEETGAVAYAAAAHHC